MEIIELRFIRKHEQGWSCLSEASWKTHPLLPRDNQIIFILNFKYFKRKINCRSKTVIATLRGLLTILDQYFLYWVLSLEEKLSYWDSLQLEYRSVHQDNQDSEARMKILCHQSWSGVHSLEDGLACFLSDLIWICWSRGWSFSCDPCLECHDLKQMSLYHWPVRQSLQCMDMEKTNKSDEYFCQNNEQNIFHGHTGQLHSAELSVFSKYENIYQLRSCRKLV